MAIEGYSDNDARSYKGNDIDSDGDGNVDDADNVTSTYKGNDIDSNGDGKVDNADQLDGNDSSAFLQNESWNFSFATSSDGDIASDIPKAYDVNFPNLFTTNQTFEAIGLSTGGTTATCRLRDETNNNTIASVSTTNTSTTRLTDTDWSNPSGQVKVGIDLNSGSETFSYTSGSAHTTN